MTDESGNIIFITKRPSFVHQPDHNVPRLIFLTTLIQTLKQGG